MIGCSPNNASNHYRFTGKERDSESGLDDFGARYFSSSMGRWATPDWDARPVTVPYANFGDSQSLNLYLYVRNDPVSQADADGHISNDSGGQSCLDSFMCYVQYQQHMKDNQPSGWFTVISSFGSTNDSSTAGAENSDEAGNFVVVGERPLLPGFPVDLWYHTYLEIPVVKDGKWDGKSFDTYGVLGDIKNGKGTSDNQQVRENDPLGRNGPKDKSNRNYTYDVRVTAAQREALRKGAAYWTTHECPSCGSHYILGGPASAGGGYNSNTWVYNMLIHNPAGRIEPPAIVPSPGWRVNDVGNNYYPQ